MSSIVLDTVTLRSTLTHI